MDKEPFDSERARSSRSPTVEGPSYWEIMVRMVCYVGAGPVEMRRWCCCAASLYAARRGQQKETRRDSQLLAVDSRE